MLAEEAEIRLVKIVYELVVKGVAFMVYDCDKCYEIEITGY
jgi:hypothetical protein